MGLFSNMKLFSFGAKITDEAFDDLEEQLILADVGMDTAVSLVDTLRRQAKKQHLSDPAQLAPVFAEEVGRILDVGSPVPPQKPLVILMIGVNGAGKTTTIGKLSRRFANEGKKVILAAGDTFRAAGIEQLVIWGSRLNVPVVAGKHGGDAASVAVEST